MTKQTKKMLISVNEDETRVALVRPNHLDDLYIEQTHNERTVGNIYYGKVVKIHSGFQAAFIDYGAERHGFLPLSDINFQLFSSNSSRPGRPSIQNLLRPGQTVCVQVLKDEIGNKGAALTTNISLPGRFLVFMPHSDKGGVSRKIEDPEQRQRLKDLLDGLVREEGAVIIRTAGIQRSLTDLKRDFMTLRRRWKHIQKSYEEYTSPGLIHAEEDVVVRMLRDYYTDDMQEVWIDEPEAFQRSLEFFRNYIPSKQKRLHLYVGDHPLFSVHAVEKQIEELSSNCVSLESGGSIVIDQTEALVAVDVNSGKSDQETGIEDTALRTNVEAAREVARQLRLRNLGGLIVIDFIDMNLQRNKDTVVKTLEENLQGDKAKWSVGGISQFGLLEMSRQRMASTLLTETKTVCQACGGSGSVLSVPSLSSVVLRRLREIAASGLVSEIHGKLHLELTNYLLNKKRDAIMQLELEFDIRILLMADLSMGPGQLPDFDVKLLESDQIVPSTSILRDSRNSRKERSRGGRRRDRERTEDTSTEKTKPTERASKSSERDSEKPSRSRRPHKAESTPEKLDPTITSEKETPLVKSAEAKQETVDAAKAELPKASAALFQSQHREAPPNAVMLPLFRASRRGGTFVLIHYNSIHRNADGSLTVQEIAPVQTPSLDAVEVEAAPEEVPTAVVSAETPVVQEEKPKKRPTKPATKTTAKKKTTATKTPRKTKKDDAATEAVTEEVPTVEEKPTKSTKETKSKAVAKAPRTTQKSTKTKKTEEIAPAEKAETVEIEDKTEKKAPKKAGVAKAEALLKAEKEKAKPAKKPAKKTTKAAATKKAKASDAADVVAVVED